MWTEFIRLRVTDHTVLQLFWNLLLQHQLLAHTNIYICIKPSLLHVSAVDHHPQGATHNWFSVKPNYVACSVLRLNIKIHWKLCLKKLKKGKTSWKTYVYTEWEHYKLQNVRKAKHIRRVRVTITTTTHQGDHGNTVKLNMRATLVTKVVIQACRFQWKVSAIFVRSLTAAGTRGQILVQFPVSVFLRIRPNLFRGTTGSTEGQPWQS